MRRQALPRKGDSTLNAKSLGQVPLDESTNGFKVSIQPNRTDNAKTKQQLENTYKLHPDPETDGQFSAHAVEQVCESVLVSHLENVDYDPARCRQLSQELAAQIMDSIKALRIRKHKLVAVVSIGSLKERAGLQFGSRCLWNQVTDTFATVKFANNSLFAVAMIYGLYYD